MDKLTRKGPIFCGIDGKWKEEIERRIENGENPISLLALGKVKYELLNYLNKRGDIKIIKVETKYMKKREKGLGIKVVVGIRHKTCFDRKER
jgi:two-component SAPR family response regulator